MMHASYLPTQPVICDSVQYKDRNNTGNNQNFSKNKHWFSKTTAGRGPRQRTQR